jgi:hypothetical protein
VVVTVESDGHRRPIKEAGDCRLYGENLTRVLACTGVPRGGSRALRRS